MQKQNCNLPIGRKNSLSRVSKVTCGLLFCLTTCSFAVDGKVNMGSNGVDDKKVVPLVGTTKTKLDGVNQEGFKECFPALHTYVGRRQRTSVH